MRNVEISLRRRTAECRMRKFFCDLLSGICFCSLFRNLPSVLRFQMPDSVLFVERAGDLLYAARLRC
jgi:hypothetical protein